ncbi:stress-responsive transcription factor hsf1 [Rhizopus stolonifer]|uniref:Stress-responsive transcription factor hsf1 n=1 Tax=Rhizopus stolonifer TaxID=4846 RepID=A0A367JRP2_RHIST|nr:stress-responsive transcription factor hsf1 [Rhizopus stolonifer]
MSEVPTVTSIFESLPPGSTTQPESSAQGNSQTTNPALVVNSSQTQRNKLQNVPAFLNKLYGMVDDASTDDLIRWAPDGLSFLVLRHEEFAKKVLPRFFKHSNFSSFVRQLNMYGFHKVPHLQNGVLSTEGELERWEFSNPHFQQSQPDLLLLVTRKKGRDPEEKEAGASDINHILDEISAIKKHQMSISNELKNVQNDNEILWQENVASKERHIRHQETIDKILQFLASVFSSDKNKHGVTPRKRQYLLEAGTAEDLNKKPRCKIESVDDEEDNINNANPSFNSSEDSDSIPDLKKDANIPLASDVKYATSELADAIELNNQTKKATAESLNSIPLNLHSSKTSTYNNRNNMPVSNALTIDFSSLINSPQFQGLISLANSNPALFNHLTSSSYFNSSSEANTKPQPTSSVLSPVVETPTSTALGGGTSTVSTPSSAGPSIENNELDNSFKTLVSELGFEAERFALEGNSSMDYLNIEDFLNTYCE